MAIPDITKIPAPRTPLLDENSGDMTPAWYRFFYNLFGLAGSGGDGGVPVNRGGTGQTSYTDGQLLIGNSIGNTLSKNTLTPGAGTTITNGHGTIEIAFDGVTSLTAGPGISVDQPKGDVTVSNTGVLSFNADSTGLTPATSTTGNITLSGTLNTTHGGTGASGTLTGYVKGNGASPMTASPTVPYTDLGKFPYGQFYSTSGQTAAAINTVYTVTIDTQDGHNLMSLATNAVTVTNAGVYNIMFSFQFTNTSASVGNVAFWPAINGTDVPWSATSIAVTAKHAGSDGYTSAAANVLITLNAGDVVTMRWVTDSTSCSIFANSTPPPFTAPYIPGIILTLQFVSAV
jgi:hypothetical protein